MGVSVVCGMGEIGRALAAVLAENYRLVTKDVDTTWVTYPDRHPASQIAVGVLHICFPWSDGFVDEVKRYQAELRPEHTVIHSTVPVGTSRRCGAIHSPVIGRHPHLERSIRTMRKFLGGEQASEVADYFRRAGLEVYITDKQESTELCKILCTTSLGVYVEWTKEIKRQCDRNGVPFELWSIWTDEYNAGFERMGMPTVHRPNLVPIMTTQGGHCVLPNLEFLESPFADLVKEANECE